MSSGNDLPDALALRSIIPNPFNPATQISFDLPTAAPVLLQIFDIRGNLVRTLVDESRAAGQYHLIWDGTGGGGRPLPSGTYLVQLWTENRGVSRSATLAK